MKGWLLGETRWRSGKTDYHKTIKNLRKEMIIE